MKAALCSSTSAPSEKEAIVAALRGKRLRVLRMDAAYHPDELLDVRYYCITRTHSAALRES